jgi:glutamate carboxypeptidase
VTMSLLGPLCPVPSTAARAADPPVAPATFFLLAGALALVLATPALQAQTLSPDEERIARYVEANVERTIDRLERTVNVNSGTLNIEGNREVARIMTPWFEAVGLDVRWSALPPDAGRAGHLIAERRGTRGKRLLLIGHLDTVFEPDHPFQRFERDGDSARGPGVIDMKGGNLVIVLALEALHSIGALDDTSIIVVLTGDEESPGRPLEVSRRDLWEAAERSDIALGFEAGSVVNGVDHAVVARRSASSWHLEAEAVTAHSSTIFRDEVGAGAIFEVSRILNGWYSELRGEQYLTFNVGVLVGGAEARYDAGEGRGVASGKTNIIPERVIATGDIRTISDEQLQRTRERMRHIVERGLPGTSARISFIEGYPSMYPTAANYELLARYDQVSRDLGYGEVVPFDPGARGAADIAFVAEMIEAGLDGLGPSGSGGHTVDEVIDLRTIPKAAARAAVLMYRLTR